MPRIISEKKKAESSDSNQICLISAALRTVDLSIEISGKGRKAATPKG